MYTPKISIVTIAYNCEKEIEETILSVINQQYDNKEYLIIDGASKDGTMDIVDKYRDKIDFLIYGTKSHPLTYPFKLIANCFKSAYFYLKVHPDYIITTGTHTAGPICCIGKIYMETKARPRFIIESYVIHHKK